MKSSLWLCLAYLAGLSWASQIGSSVKINAGVVQGRERNAAGITEFLGIPFANPPVGNFRWRPPQPVSEFNGTVNATAFRASCYSALMPGGPFGESTSGPVSEDCLSVNVWTGATDTTEKRPVMVWIYGGGFQFGGSSQPDYNGTNLSREGVVLVSFNYRLGVLGFLGLPELDSEGPSSGNYGLQDQLAALQWVQENIAQFGGDPDNVTIFGQSAGAHSVGLLLASPRSNGLFHKAILESGAYWDSEHGSIQNLSEARARGSEFQRKLGATSLAELRSMSATTINNAALWNSSTDPAITAFAPSIDGNVITSVPAKVFGEGRSLKVPVMAGFNAGEELLFQPRALPHATSSQYRQSTQTFFGPNANAALRLYPGMSASQANESAAALNGDLVIRQQTFEALDTQAAANGQTSYGYYFTYQSPYSPVAAHSAEIAFVFGNLGSNSMFGTTPASSATDQKLSKIIMSYWTSFAKYGNPNGADGSLPRWPSYNGKGSSFLQLGNNISRIDTPSMERYGFISSLRNNGALPNRWRDEFVIGH